MKRTSLTLFVGLIFWLMLITLAQAQPASIPQNPAPPGKQETGTASPAEKYFSDVELINQDGQRMRFYTDVLKDKVVIINTFFATCNGVCPPMNRTLAKIQDALGDRLGKDAFLVSISVDPEMDTPPRLKEYGRKFHARPGSDLSYRQKGEPRLGAIQARAIRRQKRRSPDHYHYRERAKGSLEESIWTGWS